MSNTPAEITSPVGRLVWGSPSKTRTTDAEGKPLLIKNGQNAGQPRSSVDFGVAIPKTPGVTHWANEAHPFFKLIWANGHAAFPQGQAQRPDFAWKITDGDSQIPNKRGRKPCEQEGYPGHWVVSFSSGSAPSTWNADGSQPVPAESIKTGYYVQVFGNVVGNNSPNQPGVYLNHRMVALSAYGPEIQNGPDPRAAGFGQGVQLPPGASTTPPAQFNASAPTPAPPAPTVAQPVAPVAVAPNPGFLVPPAVGAAPAPAPLAAAAPAAPTAPTAPTAPALAGKVLTAKAGAVPYAEFIARGWTDAMLVAHGYLAA